MGERARREGRGLSVAYVVSVLSAVASVIWSSVLKGIKMYVIVCDWIMWYWIISFFFVKFPDSRSFSTHEFSRRAVPD